MLVRVAAVMRGRAGTVPERLGVRAHSALPSETMCSTGRPVSLRSRSIRSRRSQPERALGNVETMISSTRSSWVASIAEVYGSGCTTWPCAVDPLRPELRERAAKPPRGLGARHVARLRRHDQEARRPLRGTLADAVEKLLRDHGLVRDHEDVPLELDRIVVAGDDVAHRQPARGLRDLADDVAAQSSPSAERGGSRR